MRGGLKFVERRRWQFEQMLVGMGGRLHRVILAGRVRHFDVSAEQHRDRVGLCEFCGAVSAGGEGRELVGADIKASSVEHVAREQQLGARVIDHDVRGLVPRGRDDRKRATAEVVGCNTVGPVLDAEEGCDFLWLQADYRGVGAGGEFAVALMMIAVAVRVGDDEGDRFAIMRGEPLGDNGIDCGADLQATGTAVDQQRAIAAEQQVEKRCLEIGADRLADDESVGVVFLDLSLGLRRRCAVYPGSERVCGVGETRMGQRRRDCEGQDGQKDRASRFGVAHAIEV